MKKAKSLEAQVNIIKVQRNLLHQLFNDNHHKNIWKLLIFDSPSRHIINSLYKVKDLRESNITLYLNIKQKRQQLHGVTAIYVITPEQNNIQTIVSDFQNDLYSSVIIHFTSKPTEILLSTLAKKLQNKKNKPLSKIEKVQYSTLGYYCIDNRMAILDNTSQIVNLLIALRNPVLFIYANSQQHLVLELKQKLQSYRQYIKSQSYTLLIIMNRQFDQFPIFSHGVNYASLMSDVYNIDGKGYRVSYKSGNKEESHEFYLNDDIWVERKNMPISEMGLDRQSNKIKTKMMNDSKSQESGELMQVEKRIGWHVSAAEQLIREGKRRRLNEFYEVQQQLYSKKMLAKDSFNQAIDLLTNCPEKNDKIRFMIIYVIYADSLDELQQLETAFGEIKKNNYYNQKKSKRLSNLKNQSNQSLMVGGRYLKKFAKGIWKNLLTTEKKYQLVKYIAKLKDINQNDINDLDMSYDGPKEKPKINDVVVYCSGGICFNQYSNLMENYPNCYYTGDRIVNCKDYLK